MARPTEYNKDLGDRICNRIAEGESLRAICRDDEYPNKSTVFRWLLSTNPIYKEFCDQYAIARQIQYECLADDIIDISDDGSNDYIERISPEGELSHQVNGEVVQRSRLRVDTRKWFLSKVLPKFKDKPEEKESENENLADVISKLIDRLPN